MRAILIPFLFLSISCSSQVSNSKNYYFPVKNFLSEKTYCFTNAKDTSEKAFWTMKTFISENDTIFQTIILNNDLRTEKMVEKIQNGNSKILSYTLYNNGKTSVCTIIDSLVYKFNQKKEEEIKWSVTFQNFNTPDRISLIKTRHWKSAKSGRQIFLDEMKMNKIGTSEGYEYSVTSIYEKGKGLISYTITRSNGDTKEFKLTEIK